MLLSLRRHLALTYPDMALFVVARTERLMRVYSRLGLKPVWTHYGAMSSEAVLEDHGKGKGNGDSTRP